MDKKTLVKEIFRNYLKNTFCCDPQKLQIYIYGLEYQVCGGILKFEDELDITLMHSDLRFTGCEYTGHVCLLPEMCVPFADTAVVLVSRIYAYQFEEVRDLLAGMGVKKENIVHANELAQKLLEVSADYFSQNAMDLKVKTLLDSVGRDISKIKYLDIGANIWSAYNNSYLFYRAGSNGVLVEANPDFVDSYKTNRSRDTVIMCGCSDVESTEVWTYYKTNHAGYNTFLKEVADTYESRGLHVEEIKIPMKYIGTILDENFQSKHIDYMSVDVEGMGARIVNAIDFSQYTIDIILLEMDFDKEESRKLYLKMLDLGYAAKYRGIGAGKDFLFYRKDVFDTNIL